MEKATDVVHQFQAGVVARDQVGHRDAEQFGEDSPQARQAAGHHSCGCRCPPPGSRSRRSVLVRLVMSSFCGWFAAGEIQVPASCPEAPHNPAGWCVVPLALGLLQRVEIVGPFAESKTVYRVSSQCPLKGDPAHPTEPVDPCCLPALGEFRIDAARGPP